MEDAALGWRESADDFAALGDVSRLSTILALLNGPARRRDLVAITGLDETSFSEIENDLLARGVLFAKGESVRLESAFSARCRGYLAAALCLRLESGPHGDSA